MRFRLFKQGRRPPLLALSFTSLSCFLLDAACSGEAFTSSTPPDSSAGAGAAGESEHEGGDGGSAEGGAAGASSGGRSGAPSNAGSAGKPPAGCDCTTGQYCQDATNNCRECTDYSRLAFGPAQKLTTPGAPTSERFARPAGAGSAMFYVADSAGDSKIWYAASPVSGVGTPVTLGGEVESGPLLAKTLLEHNLFFDRRHTGGERKLHMAVWTASATLTKEALMPEPINAPGFDDYSIAISPDTGHVYWMSTRGSRTELLWQATNEMDSSPAVLELKVKAGSSECARTGEDATPWVNLAGNLLLFRNPSLSEKCEPNDSGATDLFAVELNDDGTAHAAAKALASINNIGGMSSESDPTLSNDSCAIYFAADNGSGDFDLYKAQRN